MIVHRQRLGCPKDFGCPEDQALRGICSQEAATVDAIQGICPSEYLNEDGIRGFGATSDEAGTTTAQGTAAAFSAGDFVKVSVTSGLIVWGITRFLDAVFGGRR